MHIGEGSLSRPSDAAHSEVQEAPKTGQRGHEATVGKQPGPAKDIVTISQGSHLVQQAMESGSSAREGRVAELRAQFQQGAYAVDSGALSQVLAREFFATS